MRLFLISFLFFFNLTACASEKNDINEGIEYEKLKIPQNVSNPEKIEIIEFFSYACPHCYHLEPHVEKWLSNKPNNYEFIRVPAIFNKNWEAFASLFYTAEALGILDKVHGAIFDAIHGSGKKIRNLNDLKSIFMSYGVSAEDFDQTLNSFSVANKTRKAKSMTHDYEIKSVPMIIVNGKFRTNSTLAHGHENVFKVVEHIANHTSDVTKKP